ncbi:hypothetical protein K438DRAFT_1888349 [Mycena galopus ATCC 62051]|nr:hypothetical protein K438DRAFT_1888349 [Mycena galopus ATCC 62051]
MFLALFSIFGLPTWCAEPSEPGSLSIARDRAGLRNDSDCRDLTRFQSFWYQTTVFSSPFVSPHLGAATQRSN